MAQVAQPIEMQFGVRLAWAVGPTNHIVDCIHIRQQSDLKFSLQTIAYMCSKLLAASLMTERLKSDMVEIISCVAAFACEAALKNMPNSVFGLSV